MVPVKRSGFKQNRCRCRDYFYLVRGTGDHNDDVEGVEQYGFIANDIECQAVELVFSGGRDDTTEVQGEVQHIDSGSGFDDVVEGGFDVRNEAPLIAFDLERDGSEVNGVDQVTDGFGNGLAECGR